MVAQSDKYCQSKQMNPIQIFIRNTTASVFIMVSFTMYWLIRGKKKICASTSVKKKKNLTGSGWFVNHFLNVFFNCTKKHWPHKHRHVGVKEAHLLINKHRFFINVPLFKFGLCSVEKHTDFQKLSDCEEYHS